MTFNDVAMRAGMAGGGGIALGVTASQVETILGFAVSLVSIVAVTTYTIFLIRKLKHETDAEKARGDFYKGKSAEDVV